MKIPFYNRFCTVSTIHMDGVLSIYSYIKCHLVIASRRFSFWRHQRWYGCSPRVLQLLKHVIKYCEKVYERSGKNLFWSIKNSGEIIDKLKAREFNVTCLSTYDFSTPYTTLPHNLIKDKLIDLIENTFQREGSPYLACYDRHAFFASEKPNKMHCHVKCMCCADLFVGQHFYSIWHQAV